MSMGIGVGDIVTVANLARQLYTHCKNAPGEFQAASMQAQGVATVLEEISSYLEKTPPSPSQEERLNTLCGNCSIVLEKFNAILAGYESLGTQTPGKRNRLLWDKAQAQEFRQQLDQQLSVITAFKTSLIGASQGDIMASQADIQAKLNTLIQDVQRGLTDSKAVTSALDYSEDATTRFNQLSQTLGNYNISRKEVEENKLFIENFLQSAYAEGRIAVKVEHHQRIAPGNPMRTQAPTQMVLPTTMPMRPQKKIMALWLIPPLGFFVPFFLQMFAKSDYRKLRADIENNNIEKARSRMLLGASAPWLESQGFHGLHVAAENGWIDMARLLVSSGLPVNVQDSKGQRPLHVACAHGQVEIAEFFMQDDPTQIWNHDYNGTTPLHAACSTSAGRTVRMVRRLVDRGAELESIDDHNETPLLLLFREVCTANQDDSTLESKWSQNDIDVVQFLLQKGAQRDVHSDSGKGLSDYLSLLPNPTVSQLLSAFGRR